MNLSSVNLGSPSTKNVSTKLLNKRIKLNQQPTLKTCSVKNSERPLYSSQSLDICCRVFLCSCRRDNNNIVLLAILQVMAGSKFQYDESGGTFFYFLLSFLALVIIPCTYYFYPSDIDKKGEFTLELNSGRVLIFLSNGSVIIDLCPD